MKRLIVFFSLAAIFSCTSSVPENVLAPDKMQSVLWDMAQADEMAEYYSSTDSSFRGLAKHVDYYQKIFAIHKISKQQFVESLRYYEHNPSKLKTILDSLQKFGERIQKADTIKREVTPIAADTLNKQLTPPVKQH